MSEPPGWAWPPDRPRVSNADVHVWQAGLDLDERGIRNLEATLSADERERANRFAVEAARRRFIVARGVLRDILSRYLAVPAAALRFAYGRHGKPRVLDCGGACCTDDSTGKPGEEAAAMLRFNVSHRDDLALYAVTCAREVGVDVESLERDVRSPEIAGRYFTAAEAGELADLTGEAGRRAFFGCWTRKEALLKAKGVGLSLPLNSFTVSVDPDRPARLLSTSWDPDETACWSLVDVIPDGRHVGAVAVAGSPACLRLWRWTDRPGQPTTGEMLP